MCRRELGVLLVADTPITFSFQSLSFPLGIISESLDCIEQKMFIDQHCRETDKLALSRDLLTMACVCLCVGGTVGKLDYQAKVRLPQVNSGERLIRPRGARPSGVTTCFPEVERPALILRCRSTLRSVMATTYTSCSPGQLSLKKHAELHWDILEAQVWAKAQGR